MRRARRLPPQHRRERLHAPNLGWWPSRARCRNGFYWIAGAYRYSSISAYSSHARFGLFRLRYGLGRTRVVADLGVAAPARRDEVDVSLVLDLTTAYEIEVCGRDAEWRASCIQSFEIPEPLLPAWPHFDSWGHKLPVAPGVDRDGRRTVPVALLRELAADPSIDPRPPQESLLDHDGGPLILAGTRT